MTRKRKSRLYKVQKTRTRAVRENLTSRARLKKTMADSPAPRGRPGPQLKGPPQFKIQDLNMQVQGCQKATQ